MMSFGEGSERLKRSHRSSLTSVKEEEEEREDVLEKKMERQRKTKKRRQKHKTNTHREIRGCGEVFFLEIKWRTFF
jgi:hypothetical protein